MKNSIRVAICVMLVVTVLAMSLSVFADNEPSPTPTPELDEGLGAVTDEMLSRYIWLCLRAWGINIAYQDMDVFYDEVESQIIDWVLQYLAGLPSMYSINQWIAPWQGGFDYWGNLRLNSNALEDIQDFADWLIKLLGLQDNTTNVINPVYSIGGYNLYRTNTWYLVDQFRGEYPNRDYGIWKVSTDRDLYFFVVTFADNVMAYYFVDTQSNNVNLQVCYSADMSNTTMIQGGGFTLPFVNTKGLYYIGWTMSNYAIYPQGGTYFQSNVASPNRYNAGTDIETFMANASIQEVGDMEVIVSTMLLPDIDPAYTDGDSITIIDGEPEYSVVEWQSVTVENLPAIVSTQKVSNPHLESFWGFIPVLAEQTKDAIVLARGLIYEMPDEVVIMFYSVMGGLILFGVIKLMREH